MINFTAYEKILNAQSTLGMVYMTDLVALGNILKSGEIEATVVQDNNSTIEVSGLWDVLKYLNRYVVVGREIVLITSATQGLMTTTFSVNRAQYGTLNSYLHKDSGYDMGILIGYFFRTVTIFDTKSFSMTPSGNSSDVFSFQIDKGNVKIAVDSYKDWNRALSSRIYNLNPNDSVAYIFRGYNSQRVLMNTGFIKRWYYTNGRSDGSTLSIDFYEKFTKWDNKKMDKVFSLTNVYPKDFFNAILGIPQSMVLYTNGLVESDFYPINGVHSKEFTTYKDLISTYYKHGVRFCYDELERLKVFTDVNGTKVQPTTSVSVLESNITDSSANTENALIINSVTSSYKERLPMKNFVDELHSKAKYFTYSASATNYTMLKSGEDFNTLTLSDATLFRRTLIGDYVLLKDNLNGIEFYAKVMQKIAPNSSELMLGRFDKDYLLLPRGKYNYLSTLGYGSPRNFTIHFGIVEMPVIWALSINRNGEELATNIQQPLLPQISGDTTNYLMEWNASFGSATNLEIGSYSGLFDNINNIYGTFNNSQLLYNREYSQFGGNYPYIGALSTRTTTLNGNSADSYIKFDTFDNSYLEISTYQSANFDMILTAKNTKVINSSELKIDIPLNVTTTLVKVSAITGYNVGDVLVINKPNVMTTTEYNLWYKNKDIKFKIKTILDQGGGDYYLLLDEQYPSSSSMSYFFSFTRYLATSIVYLNEIYLKGNPIIELDTEVENSNSTSVERYEEQAYAIDGRFYCSNSLYLKNILAYFIDNFAMVKSDESDFKQIITVKVRDKYEIQKGDVVKIKDSIYTGTTELDYWYVLGVAHTSKSPETSFTLINCSKFDANGESLEFKNQLDYTTTTTVDYTYTASTSDVGKAVVSGDDSDLGSMSISRINRANFRADVLSIVDNKITFNTFEGSDLAKYRSAIFCADSEFVILAGGEYLYLKYYDNGDVSELTESCTIIKRVLFKTAQEDITANTSITFYNITSGVNVSGNLVSTSAYIGTKTDHLKFTPIIGMEVKTKGEVDISNANNRFYFDPASTNNKSQFLMNVGDWTTGFDGIEFQIGLPTNGKGYFKYDDTVGLTMSGIINLDTANSYIHFDSGYDLKSYNDAQTSGFIVTNYPTGGDAIQFGFDTVNASSGILNYQHCGKGLSYSYLLTQGFMGDGITKSAHLSYRYHVNANEESIVINGLTVGNEPVHPMVGSLRMSGTLLQVYYSSWVTVMDLANGYCPTRLNGKLFQVYYNNSWITVANVP